MIRRHRLAIGVALLMTCATVAACGGGDSAAPTEGGVTKLKVIETAGVPAAFLDYGIERGYFKDQKLDLEVQAATGGAATLPSIIKGDAQLIGSNVVSVLLASKKGLPVQFVTGGAFATRDPKKDYSAVVVSKKSPVRSPKELEGRTIAVNTVNGIGDLTIKASLAKKGVDVSKLKFLEFEFPDMPQALASGRIDAAWLIEPFLSGAVGKGARVLDYPYADTRPGIQVGSYAGTKQFVAGNGPAISGFRKALGQTAKSVKEDPAAFRKALPELAKTPPAAANRMTLPSFSPRVDRSSLELYAKLMQKYGLVKGDIDTAKTVAE